MLEVTSAPLAYLLATVQFTGLVSAFIARLGEGSSRQASCQTFFMGALAVVGLTAMLGLVLGSCPCLISVGTLAVMVLGAVWDPGQRG